MKITHFILAILFICAQGFALSIPKASSYDKKITFATYNADDVFEIRCANGYVTTLKFASDERIINIATGFSAGWELIDKQNYLFIKPKAYAIIQAEQNLTSPSGEKVEFNGASFIQPNSKDWRTNLSITTNKRDYIFELVLSNKPSYKVSFSYPDDEKLQKSNEQRKKQLAMQKASIQKDLQKTSVPKNWDFLAHINKGSDDIAPDFVYDDGIFTYLGFSQTKNIPSAFMFDKQNQESILNTHIKKDGNYDVLVVHRLAKQILLRSGEKLVGIFNRGFGKNLPQEPQSTINKSITREIISEQGGKNGK